MADEQRPTYDELAALVVEQAKIIEQLQSEVAGMDRLRARVAELERIVGQNSGNSGKPPSRDSAAERQRQAEERKKKAQAAGGAKRRQGKQTGSRGTTLEMSDTPDEIVEHRPQQCAGCGSSLDPSADRGYRRRQVIEVPPVKPVVIEHRAHTYLCGCGCETTAAFPAQARAPVSYGPRARSIVSYLLSRQHIPNRRVVEAMRDLFGLDISSGAVDSIFAEAGRRLGGFITALVGLLTSMAVLHVDETSDRLETKNCWMHVISTPLYTLIHASLTRGEAAIEEMGVLLGYRGVLVHDRLAMYWKLKRAKHQACGAHLLRDLADVAVVATQTAWAAGLAALLVEINNACHQARDRGEESLPAGLRRKFSKRYDDLVAAGLAVNPEPTHRKRGYHERRSFNLVTAFATHKQSILRFMNDLATPMTNNEAERALRPSKLSVYRPSGLGLRVAA
ncbi:IS66 family transposase [Acidiferrimicrobium sp. IK]|uniref:IS66 family transposase n=1 Tax=Acidiferrimicrobium sp. IK TaxID=2871700 RepID=UPI0021CB3BC3|nr:IS66 family transposase [Acidiferrimicrobium sp. IK]MCU4187450.1 IS66 family transposase [Acidiferrimicrobium sp. IK]